MITVIITPDIISLALNRGVGCTLVSTFLRNEKWASSFPWMSSECDPTCIVFGAILSSISSFRTSGGQTLCGYFEKRIEDVFSPLCSFILYFGQLAFPEP